MKITVSWDADIFRQLSGGILGAVTNLVSLIEIRVQQGAIPLESAELRVRVTDYNRSNRNEETTFRTTLVLGERCYESRSFQFFNPPGYDEPFFLLGDFRVTPDIIFREVIYRAMGKDRLKEIAVKQNLSTSFM